MKWLSALLLVVVLALNSWADNGYVLDTFLGKFKTYAVTPYVVVTKTVAKPVKRRDGVLGKQMAWNLAATERGDLPFPIYYRWYLLVNPVEVSEVIPKDFIEAYKEAKPDMNRWVYIYGGREQTIEYLKAWATRNST